jgi:hypothetical protein
MTKLAPNLFERRFNDLMEIGRARLPSLSPQWTDYNAHDPGITLMELLAWVAEAQLYSVSRMRRDERLAYAALLGLSPAGARPARGVLWSDRSDPDSPATRLKNSVVIARDAAISLKGGEETAFRPTYKLLWAPGRTEKLETRSANGQTIDHTFKNEQGGLPFLPFGDAPGRRDALRLTFAARDNNGLFGRNRDAAMGALWAIGVIAADTGSSKQPPGIEDDEPCHSPLSASVVAGDERFPVVIVLDSTRGLLTTGAILLDLDSVSTASENLQKVSFELSFRQRPAKPPQVLRIEPNVIPIMQGRKVAAESHVSIGVPDWSFALGVPGLSFAAGQEPVEVDVAESTGRKIWKRCDRLSEQGPNDDVYELDTDDGQVTFGNGVNGRIPPAASQVLVTYSVSDGAAGNVARNRKWKVTGVDGTFGKNPDPIIGGSAPLGWTDFRRQARRSSRNDHALVSAADIETAARSLPLLEVERAWVIRPGDGVPRTGVVTLVAMRGGSDESRSGAPRENRQWLEAVRRGLTPRMPLASRLIVVAPRYIEFSIEAELDAVENRDPSEVRQDVLEELERRLALTEMPGGVTPRQPGVPVTVRDINAWMRATNGVKRVTRLAILDGDGKEIPEVAVPDNGLPSWNSDSRAIRVIRSRRGGANEG